jgi:L-fucose mutarotase
MKGCLALRTVLKGIPPILSPELLSVLARMGHGDEIVIADANFPSASVAKNSILVRADGICASLSGKSSPAGHSAIPMVKAILQLLPLDKYVPTPVGLDNSVWLTYRARPS